MALADADPIDDVLDTVSMSFLFFRDVLLRMLLVLIALFR